MALRIHSKFLSVAAASLAALIASCGGGSGGSALTGGGNCSATREKDFVLDAAREWYLFPELLPASISASDYPTAEELLDALTATARAQGRDRYFSYLTTRAADSSILQEGEYIGFGFRTAIDLDRLLVPDVYEGSPADGGGLARGAEITHVDSGNGYVPIATVLATDPELEQAFGPATAGVQRGLRFVLPGGQQIEAVFTKGIVTIPPVPADGVTVFPLPSNPSVPVGYINLRTFISTAETPLRAAYAQFRAQGIQNFVVDFRYNGGGLVSIAELVGDLQALGRSASDVYSKVRHRPSKSSNDSVRRFNVQPQSVEPVRIAFITTAGTASASELVINGMKPWVEVAIVGADTYGKPVGQLAFDLSGCETRLRLVSFKITNADDEGDYYDGLASSMPFACAAADDLTREPWDSTESSTAAALTWLGTGACPAIMTAPAVPLLKAATALRLPQARRPTAAQTYLPGLF